MDCLTSKFAPDRLIVDVDLDRAIRCTNSGLSIALSSGNEIAGLDELIELQLAWSDTEPDTLGCWAALLVLALMVFVDAASVLIEAALRSNAK